jgi:hypothetical protein
MMLRLVFGFTLPVFAAVHSQARTRELIHRDDVNIGLIALTGNYSPCSRTGMYGSV